MAKEKYGRNLRGIALWLWHNVAPGAVISLVLLLILAAGGETYLRLRAPFTDTIWPGRFDPRTGFIFAPDAEVATTNNLDYWTRQRANSLGFLDREPVPPERRPGSCHLVFIGDSFVEAHQVTIEQKVQVVLENLAAERFPTLKLTAAGYGQSDTGQVNQLAIYDHFVRREKPKIVVLVAVKNDFSDNSAVLQAINHGRDPDHMPRVFARRGADGAFALQPIDPDFAKYPLAPAKTAATEKINPLAAWLRLHSLAFRWFDGVWWRVGLAIDRRLFGETAVAAGENRIARNARLLAQRPKFSHILDGWDPTAQPAIDEIYFEDRIPPVFREALEFTGFALDQFRERARRDGFYLVILASQTLKREGGSDLSFKRLKALADARKIPVIDQFAYIEAHGGRVRDARFLGDGHWSPQGHRWAAEAVLDHLASHPDLCR